MLQCLEWEPSGSFYQSSNIKIGQNGAPGPSRINYSQDIADPSLPPNPRKAILYRPSVTHFIAVSRMWDINIFNLFAASLFWLPILTWLVFKCPSHIVVILYKFKEFPYINCSQLKYVNTWINYGIQGYNVERCILLCHLIAVVRVGKLKRPAQFSC